MPNLPGVRAALPRGDPGRGDEHDGQPALHAARAGAPAHRLRGEAAVHRSGRSSRTPGRPPRRSAWTATRSSWSARATGTRRRSRSCSRRGRRGARGRDRPRERPRGDPLLERHDRAAQGRDAEPSQPDRQRPAVRRGDPGRGGRRADRRPALLPHLRADGDHERRPPLRRDDRDDAALRPRRLPRADREARGDAVLRRPADRAGARQAPGDRRRRPLLAADDHVGRGAARRRALQGGRRARRRADDPGLRDDRALAGHPRRPASTRRRAARSARRSPAPSAGSSIPRPARTPTAASSGSAGRR